MAGDLQQVVRRPLAEAFDLVLSEYSGYTDEKILDLTFDRFKQMIDVIIERKQRVMKEQQRWDLLIAEIQVKAIGSLLPGLSRDKKTAKGIADAAGKIRFTDLLDTAEEKKKAEEDRLPSTSDVMRAFGIRHDGLSSTKG